jgi:hypothetical protein
MRARFINPFFGYHLTPFEGLIEFERRRSIGPQATWDVAINKQGHVRSTRPMQPTARVMERTSFLADVRYWGEGAYTLIAIARWCMLAERTYFGPLDYSTAAEKTVLLKSNAVASNETRNSDSVVQKASAGISCSNKKNCHLGVRTEGSNMLYCSYFAMGHTIVTPLTMYGQNQRKRDKRHGKKRKLPFRDEGERVDSRERAWWSETHAARAYLVTAKMFWTAYTGIQYCVYTETVILGVLEALIRPVNLCWTQARKLSKGTFLLLKDHD